MIAQLNALRTRECPSHTAAGVSFAETFWALQEQTGQLVPPRKALTLSMARPFAAYMSILEIAGPRSAIFRIMGTGHVDRTRVENTGKNWFDLAEPESHEAHAKHFRRILTTPCGCLAQYKEKYDKLLVIEAINFPFADNEGRARFIVSTNVELSIDELLTRGEASMVPGEFDRGTYIDIGAGTGE